ncbi:NADase-type glycan-binding domain-containing protein [Salinispira pacifica]
MIGEYAATSFLAEGDDSYPPTNLRVDTPSRPWVEGVDGDGIGESVTVDWQWKPGEGGAVGALIISNGFVSYDRPYLYEMNNRVRRIRVSDPAGGFSFETELDDTPNPQVVFLPLVPEKTEIEILSVYPGTRWHDTCLNYVFGLEKSRADRLREMMKQAGETPRPADPPPGD